jgi:hypothetical protein
VLGELLGAMFLEHINSKTCMYKQWQRMSTAQNTDRGQTIVWQISFHKLHGKDEIRIEGYDNHSMGIVD